MTVNPLLRPLGITAAILGTLQGLLWTVLSLLVIIINTGVWEPAVSATQIFNAIALGLFFSDNWLASDFIFIGDVVLGFACFYLIVSFIWAVLSLSLTWVYFREKYEHARISTIVWCCITFLLSLCDIALVIILAIDLDTAESYEFLPAENKFLISTVIGTVMTIVARGYVLLIVNVAISVCLLRTANEIPSAQKPVAENQPYINAYEDPFPRSWHSNENGREPPVGRGGDNNAGFIPDDNSIYHRSISQDQSPTRRFIPPVENNYIPGRPQKTRPLAPPKEQGPFIPEPDYDNPKRELERMPRSALRTKSYY